MGRSEFNWRKIVRHVFRPRADRGSIDTSVPATSVKCGTKGIRPSKSFMIFRNLSPGSFRDIRDDTSSFMSPMPKELHSRSFEDSDLPSPLSSEDSMDSDDTDEADSVRLSFINCANIIDIFPETPLVPRSQTLPSRCSPISRPPISALFRDPFDERATMPGSRSNEHIIKRAPKNHVSGRSPTSFLHPISQGSPQHAPPPVPFDLLSRTRYTHSNDSWDNPERFRSPSYASLVLSVNPQPSRISPQSSPPPSLFRYRSCNLLSRSYSSQSSSITSRSAPLSSRRLSTSISLQNLGSISPSPSLVQPSLSSSPNSPSPFRSVMSHVPGLEYRVPRSSFNKPTPNDCTRNSGGGHVPYGTPRF